MSIASYNMPPALPQLASRLEQDIRLRGLREGDRYLSTSEAASLLGVSATRAHRVLQMLAERKVVERRNRSGTYVGPEGSAVESPRIQTVIILSTPEKRQYLEAISGSFLAGINEAIPGVNVQFSQLPSRDREAFLERLLTAGGGDGTSCGLICASCPTDVYCLLAKRGIPTVISGTLPLDGPDLPSVAMDDHGAGVLLGEYLVDRSHRHMALLATTLDRPGDKLLFRGLSEPLSKAGLPHNCLVFEVVRETERSVHAAVHYLFESPNPPTAIIARDCHLAELAAAVVGRLGKAVPEEVEIVFVDHDTEQSRQSPFPHVRTCKTRTEVNAIMGQMLKRLGKKEALAERRVIVPVEFFGGKAAFKRDADS